MSGAMPFGKEIDIFWTTESNILSTGEQEDGMEENSEVIILNQGDIRITNKRAVLGAKTYAMANITSVSMTYEDKKGGLIPFIFVVVGLMVGGCVLLFSFSASGLLFWTIFLIGALITFLMVGLGVLIYLSSKPTYFVRVGSASGEANVLHSSDKAQITKIVQAINKAIVSR